MENDPSKKESKGKRIFKKALRRSSKSSNNSQHSGAEQGAGVTRSKSFESKRSSLGINDSTPLPTPDGSKETVERSETSQKNKIEEVPEHDSSKTPVPDKTKKKMVDIQESRNEVFEDKATASKELRLKTSPTSDKQNVFNQEPDGEKKNLKRKFEEESTAGTSGASTGTSDNDADDKDPSKDKKKKNRCAVCRKKVGLTGFECRCGGLFCGVHRYSDKHDCSFDYRELGAQEIRRNNPVVVSQKIHKI